MRLTSSLRSLFRTAATLLLGAQLVLMGVPAAAGTFDTGDYLAAGDRAATIDRVRDLLAEDRVRSQLSDLGVDAAMAEQRVAALTDDELMMLDAQLDSLPAGSSTLGIIGAVFVVLLILELVGVINVFNAI